MTYFNNLGQGRVGFKTPSGNYLLDTYSGAAAAYSLRKLRTAYAGAAIRVRRSPDNTSLDIGFGVDGNLDTASMLSFVGAGDGFVSIWYDQSGNGNDATKITLSSQPKIVSAGSLITQNGDTAIRFDGVDDFLNYNGTGLANNKYAIFANVSRTSNRTVNYYMAGYGAVTNGNLHIGWNSNTVYRFDQYNNGLDSTETAFTTQTNTLFSNFNTTTGHSVYKNGAILGSNSNTINLSSYNNASLGLYNDGSGTVGVNYYFYGTMSEIVIYNSNQISNRTAIESNINSYYSIY